MASNGLLAPAALRIGVLIHLSKINTATSNNVYGRSPAEIVGSNTTQGMDVCVVSVMCCQVEVSATD